MKPRPSGSFACAEHLPQNLGVKSRISIRFFADARFLTEAAPFLISPLCPQSSDVYGVRGLWFSQRIVLETVVEQKRQMALQFAAHIPNVEAGTAPRVRISGRSRRTRSRHWLGPMPFIVSAVLLRRQCLVIPACVEMQGIAAITSLCEFAFSPEPVGVRDFSPVVFLIPKAQPHASR